MCHFSPGVSICPDMQLQTMSSCNSHSSHIIIFAVPYQTQYKSQVTVQDKYFSLPFIKVCHFSIKAAAIFLTHLPLGPSTRHIFCVSEGWRTNKGQGISWEGGNKKQRGKHLLLSQPALLPGRWLAHSRNACGCWPRWPMYLESLLQNEGVGERGRQ